MGDTGSSTPKKAKLRLCIADTKLFIEDNNFIKLFLTPPVC